MDEPALHKVRVRPTPCSACRVTSPPEKEIGAGPSRSEPPPLKPPATFHHFERGFIRFECSVWTTSNFMTTKRHSRSWQTPKREKALRGVRRRHHPLPLQCLKIQRFNIRCIHCECVQPHCRRCAHGLGQLGPGYFWGHHAPRGRRVPISDRSDGPTVPSQHHQRSLFRGMDRHTGGRGHRQLGGTVSGFGPEPPTTCLRDLHWTHPRWSPPPPSSTATVDRRSKGGVVFGVMAMGGTAILGRRICHHQWMGHGGVDQMLGGASMILPGFPEGLSCCCWDGTW